MKRILAFAVLMGFAALAAAQYFQEALGQPFIIDNRPGALANVGTGEVARGSREAGMQPE